MNHSSQVGSYPRRRNLLDVVRPSFFPGQSLSDQDLTDLIQWTEQRIRLEAECDDWGIACGLHVSIDPEDSTQVLISPGYGFNAARELCLVGSNDCGCGEPHDCKCRCPKNGRKYRLPKPACNAVCGKREEAKPLQNLPDITMADVVIYDLVIQPAECPTDHQLGRSANGRPNCQATRVRSSSAITSTCYSYYDVPKELPTPSAKPLVEALKRLPQVSFPLKSGDADRIRTWLLDEVKELPLLLGATTKLLDSCVGKNEDSLTTALGIFACYARRSSDCGSLEIEDPGIPLARVWARCSGSIFEVLYVKDVFPYRRSVTCRKPEFCICDWIGQPLADAQTAAKCAEVKLDVTDLPKTISGLVELLAKEPQCSAQAQEFKVYIQTLEGEGRILTYGPVDDKETPRTNPTGTNAPGPNAPDPKPDTDPKPELKA